MENNTKCRLRSFIVKNTLFRLMEKSKKGRLNRLIVKKDLLPTYGKQQERSVKQIDCPKIPYSNANQNYVTGVGWKV